MELKIRVMQIWFSSLNIIVICMLLVGFKSADFGLDDLVFTTYAVLLVDERDGLLNVY